MIIKISKGQQITIPSSIRKEFDFNIGSKVDLEKKGNKIIIRPIGDNLHKLFDEAKRTKPKYKLTPKQMDKLVEDEVHRQ